VREVELKLDVTPEAATVIAATELLPGEGELRQLDATYFDTADRALCAAGFSLRIRTAADSRVQTVKADGDASAGLFVRSEWEMDVAGDTPVLDHTTPIRAMLGERCEEIAPVFHVTVERRIWNVEEDGAQIEVVLDRGHVRAGEREEPICEIELELKSGQPAALFSLARKLDAIGPMQIGVLSKSARGYRLTRKPRTAFKAEPVTLKPEMDAASAFQHIAQACLRQFRLNEAAVLATRAPEALHQARVALRRLRSAFSIFAPLYEGDEQAALLRQELRAIAAILGEARNLDVLIARGASGAVQDRLRSAREEAYANVDAALASPKARALILDLMEWLAIGSWLSAVQGDGAEPARSFARAALDRYRRKVKKGGRRLKKADDEARHDLRKNAKKLRYAAEFFATLFANKKARRRYKRFIAALEDMQDHLGVLNDLATAPAEIAKLGLDDDPEAQALLGTQAKPALLAAAAEAHEVFADTKRFWR
jgi:triphosphatase